MDILNLLLSLNNSCIVEVIFHFLAETVYDIYGEFLPPFIKIITELIYLLVLDLPVKFASHFVEVEFAVNPTLDLPALVEGHVHVVEMLMEVRVHAQVLVDLDDVALLQRSHLFQLYRGATALFLI